jgi:sugar lactone lactonase YvrE
VTTSSNFSNNGMHDSMQCIVPSQDSLGEGCLWRADSQTLWWVDIARPSKIHSFAPETGHHRSWTLALTVTAIAAKASGGFVVAAEDGLYTFDSKSGNLSPLCHPEPDVPRNRLNDGAADAMGRFWIGSMMQNIGPHGEDLDISGHTGNLFCVEADGTSRRMEQAIGVSNGPCWSPDGRIFYFSDSAKQLIYKYDFDPAEGRISNRRVLNDTKDHGYPDGATVDADGFLWSARWEGSCVLRIDPKGRIDRVLPVPATRVTCPVFGGADMDTLYVTTSRAHVSADVLARYPRQGGIFACKPGVKGLIKNSFFG